MTSRLVAAVLIALQALLWGGGSIIEARAAAESLTRATHVEDTGNPACPPIHSHLDCLICRTLSSGATAGHATSLVGIDREATSLRHQVVTFGTTSGSGPLGSRAPPGA